MRITLIMLNSAYTVNDCESPVCKYEHIHPDFGKLNNHDLPLTPNPVFVPKGPDNSLLLRQYLDQRVYSKFVKLLSRTGRTEHKPLV